jgi:hypothetical protein
LERSFEEPIALPRGRLVTLEDAGNYITKLPKDEHTAPEWQAAMEALMLVAEKNGPTMMARIGVASAEPSCQARVQFRSQKHALGKAEAPEGQMTGQPTVASGAEIGNH